MDVKEPSQSANSDVMPEANRVQQWHDAGDEECQDFEFFINSVAEELNSLESIIPQNDLSCIIAAADNESDDGMTIESANLEYEHSIRPGQFLSPVLKHKDMFQFFLSPDMVHGVSFEHTSQQQILKFIKQETPAAESVLVAMDIIQQHVECDTPFGVDSPKQRQGHFSGLTAFCDEYFFGASPASFSSPWKSPSVLEGADGAGTGRHGAPASAPTKEEQEDQRLQGDFSRWTISDIRGDPKEKLSVQGVLDAYVGLKPWGLTHSCEDGVLVVDNGANSLNIGDEIRSSPRQQHSSPTKAMHNKEKAVPKTYFGNFSNGGYYNVHLLECVVRPDIEVGVLMSAISRAAETAGHKWTMLQPDHAEISRMGSSTAADGKLVPMAGGSAAATAAAGITPLREWDIVDVQVCISRQLRQRVVLCQFMRSVVRRGTGAVGTYPSGVGTGGVLGVGAGISNLLINQIPGPESVLPYKRCRLTKQLITHIKIDLTSRSLSLSSLYTCPLRFVCALPQELDIHFKKQLFYFCRASIEARLENDFREMDSHIREQEEEFVLIIKMMGPIFKEYNLTMPAVASRRSIPTQEFAADVISFEDIGNFSTQHSMVSDLEISTASDVGVVSNKFLKSGNPGADGEEENIGSHSIVSDVSILSSLPLDSGSSADLCTPPVRTVRSSQPTGGTTSAYQLDLNTQVRIDNGMTYCLIVLDSCHKVFQSICDTEYSARLRRRNEYTVLAVQDLHEQRRALLSYIAYNPNAQSSALTKTFNSVFGGVIAASNPVVVRKTGSVDVQRQLDPHLNSSSDRNYVVAQHSKTSSSHSFGSVGSVLTAVASKSAWGSYLLGASSALLQSSSTTGCNATKSKDIQTQIDEDDKSVSSTNHFDWIVLYYCACVTSNKGPVTLYLTPSCVCVTSSIPLSSYREVLPFSQLDEIVLPREGSSLLYSNSLKLVFHRASNSIGKDNRDELFELTLSPVVIDCHRLRTILLDIQLKFSPIY